MTEQNAIADLNAQLVETDKQIVARNGGIEWTRGELMALFNLIAPADNWKNPIVAMLAVPYGTYKQRADYLLGVREAVIFFTGSTPQFTQVPCPAGETGWRYLVHAAGYYRTIGA